MWVGWGGCSSTLTVADLEEAVAKVGWLREAVAACTPQRLTWRRL